MRNLILEEKIVISESTAISKIVFQALIAIISKHIISEKMKKAFCKKTLTPETNHKILCNGYKSGGLKMLMFQTKP